MTLKTLVVAPAGALSTYVRGFLEIAPFFDVVDNVPDAHVALRRHAQEPVQYFLIDIAVASAALLPLMQLAEEERPLTIVIGPEEYYYLRKATVDPQVFSNLAAGIHGHSTAAVQPPPPPDPPAAWVLSAPGTWQQVDDSAVALFLKQDGVIRRIWQEDILHVEAERDYITMATPESQYRLLRSLKSLEDLLPQESHMRIHRSHIVRLASIESMDQEFVWLDGISAPVPIGPNYRKELLRRLVLI